VQNSIAPYKGLIAHKGKLQKGSIHLGNPLTAKIDRKRRQKIANNHTATHLLHWALQQILGEHIKQAGSIVDPQRLRFDFSHHKALTFTEIRQIENLINEKIRENLPVKSYEMKFEEVQGIAEIKQFFGEKYGAQVRVVDIDYSKELCGGTHTQAVGNIGLFRIAKESSIAAGIRRIEAVTGHEAEELDRGYEDTLIEIAHNLKVPASQLKEKIDKLLEENKLMSLELKDIQKEKLNTLVEFLVSQKEQINGCEVVMAKIAVSMEELKSCMDATCEKSKADMVILAAAFPDKCQIMVRVSEGGIAKGLSAQQILKTIMPIVDGSGGGKVNMAQGGGKSPEKIEESFAAIRSSL